MYGNIETVKELLEWEGEGILEGKRVDPTDSNNQAIRSACQNGDIGIVKMLLKWKGIDKDGKDLRVDPTSHDSRS